MMGCFHASSSDSSLAENWAPTVLTRRFRILRYCSSRLLGGAAGRFCNRLGNSSGKNQCVSDKNAAPVNAGQRYFASADFKYLLFFSRGGLNHPASSNDFNFHIVFMLLNHNTTKQRKY